MPDFDFFRKVLHNWWSSNRPTNGNGSATSLKEYNWLLRAEYRAELRCRIDEKLHVFLGYLSPVCGDDIPILIPDHHLEDGDVDWDKNEVRWHDVRYVDVRMARLSEFNEIYPPQQGGDVIKIQRVQRL